MAIYRLSTDNPLGASGSVLGGRTRAPPERSQMLPGGYLCSTEYMAMKEDQAKKGINGNHCAASQNYISTPNGESEQKSSAPQWFDDLCATRSILNHPQMLVNLRGTWERSSRFQNALCAPLSTIAG